MPIDPEAHTGHALKAKDTQYLKFMKAHKGGITDCLKRLYKVSPQLIATWEHHRYKVINNSLKINLKNAKIALS